MLIRQILWPIGRTLTAITLIVSLVNWSAILWSQTPPSELPLPGISAARDPSTRSAPGGAVIADFDTLMNLIQQTIDPDSWLANGGTSTITPYPAGVYVDPKGQMKRIKTDSKLNIEFQAPDKSAARHPWRKSSRLRTISLRQLDASLAQAGKKGLQPTTDLLKLAGVSRITHVKVLPSEEDVLLAGPSGENQFGFYLEDLATVAALIKSQTVPMGCSIEPSDKGLLAVQALLQERGAIERLARNPRLVVEQMEDKLGPHNVKLFGMPACSTAVALLDADEHMKRVGFGSEVTSPRIRSYFDFLDQQASVPTQSLIRWWFAFTDDPISVDVSGKLFQLPENCVRVLSEQQWVSQQTGRAPTGAQDPAADKFAAEFTDHVQELRRTQLSYARLCGIFEMGLSLQLSLEVSGMGDLRPWFPTLCSLGSSLTQNSEVEPPKTVSGLAAWHKLKSGTIVAVVSGGVKLDLKSIADRSQWKESSAIAQSVVPEKAQLRNTSHANWWWD
jgi:Protein of unknown function (DUF1598)